MEPTTNGDNGERGEDGRFLPGNAGGPGNPYAKKVAALRGSLINAITNGDIEEIIHPKTEPEITAVFDLNGIDEAIKPMKPVLNL